MDVAAVFEKIAPISSGIKSDIEAGFLGFAFGDRLVEVTGVGVAWFLSAEVVAAAVEKRLNMLIIHEPELFRGYNSPWHMDAGIFGESREWSFVAAREAGKGIIETTHLVSKSIGFRSVAEMLRKRLAGLPVEFSVQMGATAAAPNLSPKGVCG